jgi:pathogenesis-related protein 1
VRTACLVLCSLLAAGCIPGLLDDADAGTSAPEPAPDADAQTWVDQHNAVRRSPQPAPSPALPALGWSSEAAKVAQAWADGCTYQHNAGRGQRGENIAASAPAGRWTPADVVAAWASEAADYDYAANTCAEGKQCGHYTQLVWRSTTRAGCAHKLCTVNWPFAPAPPGSWDFWVCDYEPPGNFVGQRPY